MNPRKLAASSNGMERAAFAGHSMGGYVTLALHKAAPERVSGLALVASQAYGDPPEGAQRSVFSHNHLGHSGPGITVSE